MPRPDRPRTAGEVCTDNSPSDNGVRGHRKPHRQSGRERAYRNGRGKAKGRAERSMEKRGRGHYRGRNPVEPPPDLRRATGRIEHTLLDGEFSVRPNRPTTFARNPTIP